jgi:hypothetical protein
VSGIARAASGCLYHSIVRPEKMAARDDCYQHHEKESCRDGKLYRCDPALRFFVVIASHNLKTELVPKPQCM